MLEHVTLKGKFAERSKVASFDVKPGINVLAGPNGSGKSSIIRALHERKRGGVETKHSGQFRISFFDSEKDNPRIQSHFGDGDIMTQVASMFASHGQFQGPFLLSLENLGEGDHLIVLDEPESGIDIETRLKVVEAWSAMDKSRFQFLVATHCPFLWKLADHIVELEEGYVDKGLDLWNFND